MRALRSDVFKIFLYIAAALILGAAISPWLYNFGMGLAEVTEGKETNGFLAWLGEHARSAKENFPRYFARALQLAGVILVFPLLAWLRVGREPRMHGDTPWSLRLPDGAVSMELGQSLKKNPNGIRQFLQGFLLAFGLLLITGGVLVGLGMFVWRNNDLQNPVAASLFEAQLNWGKILWKAISSALVVSLLEEVLFRGVLLGIFLRAMKPAPAIAALSFLFAFVHFLEPPAGVKVADPEAANAGFVLLGHVMSRFADPMSLIGQFTVLASVGVVLAVARYRTASLWLPIGLHFGWVSGYLIFKSVTWPMIDVSETARWMVGYTLMEGLLPLAMMLITGGVVAFLTRPRDEPKRV